ncbi:basic helix-loop-helix (bHLH) DNA-binding superfamily protein [Euphorbia peplus]|nr:basic helix-loop-helix (bHLH) DNA-binding superfamily protein [Euphorbia peplus]
MEEKEDQFYSSDNNNNNWGSFQNISSSEDSFLYPTGPHSSQSFNGVPNWPHLLIPNSWCFPVQDKDTASASNSHSQAEKRRRDRINTQLGILRKLVPESDKMDKAALLGSVIEQVKQLKEQAKEASKGVTVPTEIDEVIVEELLINNSDNNKKIKFIRASMCCDDRPEVLSELIRAVKMLRLSVARADLSSVGGRIKSILILCNNNVEDEAKISVSEVKHCFSLVLSRISSNSMPSNFRVRSKRQRFFLPSQ